jgi:hypothetical protein
VLAAVVFPVEGFFVLALLVVAEMALGPSSAVHSGEVALEVEGASDGL